MLVVLGQPVVAVARDDGTQSAGAVKLRLTCGKHLDPKTAHIFF